ncbi:MAG: hypothetical protein BGO63_00545 [Candidatus Accumulibacter sp. 66-26]|nr:hypothetical protein [Accumulibacter sp.]OJW49978.1 MAG: hypothetical protein BGO63_00545 [Candidatus Accumulibacter sp. 66-26]
MDIAKNFVNAARHRAAKPFRFTAGAAALPFSVRRAAENRRRASCAAASAAAVYALTPSDRLAAGHDASLAPVAQGGWT